MRERETVVAERRGIEKTAVHLVHRHREPVDERALVIRLERGDSQPESLAQLREPAVDRLERLAAVETGLPPAKQTQIRSVKHPDVPGHQLPLPPSRPSHSWNADLFPSTIGFDFGGDTGGRAGCSKVPAGASSGGTTGARTASAGGAGAGSITLGMSATGAAAGAVA